MTREEHTELIRNIQEKIKDIDDGTITESLATLSDDYGTTLVELENTKEELEKTKENNESLRDTNMRLFLKVGEKTINTGNPEPTSNEDKKEEEEYSIDKLINNYKGL